MLITYGVRNNRILWDNYVIYFLEVLDTLSLSLGFLIDKMRVLQRLVQGNSEAVSLVVFYYGFYQCALKGAG